MMKKITLSFLLVAFLFSLAFFLLFPKTEIKKEPSVEKPKTKLSITPKAFNELPGWSNTKVIKSLEAFQISCRAFLKQEPEKAVGSPRINLQAKDWQPLCAKALKLDPQSEKDAKAFFQKWFTPVEFRDNQHVEGLFTGYYMALLHGSTKKTKEYNVPIYGLPSDLVNVTLSEFDPSYGHRHISGRLAGNKLIPYYNRAEINNGAIQSKAKVLVWVNSRIDRLFLEIQGSGTVLLTDGTEMNLGYAGENGAPYTAIAKVLIDKGVMTRDNASMQHIKRYLEAHPKEMDTVLHQNKSFVFFQPLKNNAAYGAQGVALTAGYSLAVDRQWIPLGAPLWLHTTRPDMQPDKHKPFKRLMIAQDTGGAIKGIVRGDVYWGAGDMATFIAGHMKNKGHYWLLLPKHAVSRLQQEFSEA